MPELYSMSDFCCKLVTLLTFPILGRVLVIKGLQAHATEHFRFDARQTL